MSEQALSLFGKRFGRWTVIEKSGGRWKCKCDCGTERAVLGANLIRGLSKSCGCIGVERIIKQSTKHGFATRSNWTKEHKIWCGMMRRCYDTKEKAYQKYGLVGIKVCERWHDFKYFIEDMGLIPEGKRSIDRYPNKNGDYEPKNCRWADDFEQSRNRNNNVIVPINGINYTAREAEKILGLPKDRLQSRLKRGMSVEDAVSLPYNYRNLSLKKCKKKTSI